MSETPHNDPEHDARLTALYRAGMQDEPPPAIDDAIRAAARRAVSSKPRLAGSPFSRAWQVPMSIAAVIVLSVSLVILMREEAPEIAAPPRADAPPLPETARMGIQAAGESVSAVPKVALLPEAHEPGGIGLKPPQPAATPGIGIRRDEPPAAAVGQLREEKTLADRLPSTSTPAQRQPATAFPGSVESRETNAAAPVERPPQLVRENARRDAVASAEIRPRPAEARSAASAEGAISSATVAAAPRPAAPDATTKAESDVASVDSAAREPDRARGLAAPPVPKPASGPLRMMAKTAPQKGSESQVPADLPPEKWLERIEELRKQGRLEDARTSLAEFRKRYPDYVLPAALRDGINK